MCCLINWTSLQPEVDIFKNNLIGISWCHCQSVVNVFNCPKKAGFVLKNFIFMVEIKYYILFAI